MADDAPPPPPATVQRGGRGRGRGGKGGRARGRGGKGRGRGKGRSDDDAPSDGDDEVKEAEPGDRGRGGKGKGRAKTFGRFRTTALPMAQSKLSRKPHPAGFLQRQPGCCRWCLCSPPALWPRAYWPSSKVLYPWILSRAAFSDPASPRATAAR